MKKLGLLLLVLVGSGSLWAQESNFFSLTLNHDAISVKDVNRSVDFYKNVLHLQEITNRTEKEGIRWMSLGDGKELHLISTIKEPVVINKAVHIAFTTPEFDHFMNVLKEMKITYSDWAGSLNKISIRADGIQQVYIQDPDGYWIEINSAEKI
ncbi:VOC family protein [Flavobacterium sp. WC2421]|jgi:lactoylglutathione lyase|uniref:VOC family protein n=3 Tax=unclassified Flavobacterium TaxID=196869 RepID=A0AB39WEC6_9FLAO